MAPAGGLVTPEHLSPQLAALSGDVEMAPRYRSRQSLSAAVEKLEREMIRSALDQSAGNISETARVLGLTRRGLYLKLRRLGIETRNESWASV
jgi:DNA-binding NtrC family response regulator